jgi:hypothetical protein
LPDYIDEIRKSADLHYKKGKIEISFERVSEEEFGPLFPDEPCDDNSP